MHMNKIYFGIAGWSYRDWEGIVYPSPKPARFNQLEFIIQHVDCIEINSTFYRIPSIVNVQNWCRIANGKDNFLFTVKLLSEFTHSNNQFNPETTNEFKKILEIFTVNKVLGALLIQFPWYYGYTEENLEYIAKISSQFVEYNPCVEIRHISWDNKEVLEIFASNKIGFVNIDQPLSVQSLMPSNYATSETGYVRLHGRNSVKWFKKGATRDEKYDYSYTQTEISEWIERVKKIASLTKITFVVANNHYRGSAFFNIKTMKEKFLKYKY